MRDKRVYNKVIAISENDLDYIKEQKNKDNKKSLAGILSMIINYYKKHE